MLGREGQGTRLQVTHTETKVVLIVHSSGNHTPVEAAGRENSLFRMMPHTSLLTSSHHVDICEPLNGLQLCPLVLTHGLHQSMNTYMTTSTANGSYSKPKPANGSTKALTNPLTKVCLCTIISPVHNSDYKEGT